MSENHYIKGPQKYSVPVTVGKKKKNQRNSKIQELIKKKILEGWLLELLTRQLKHLSKQVSGNNLGNPISRSDYLKNVKITYMRSP